MPCQHTDFHVHTHVNYLEDVKSWMMEFTVKCKQCDEPFQFLGMQPGLNLNGATVSLDGLTANMAMCPESARPSPLKKIGFAINRVDFVN